ncbi:MAG TPA: hypothetical protein VFM46_05440, partial [Pseudomonadales bacterium]|nr:hypothetical protein [Pseudomonadales bacterium]
INNFTPKLQMTGQLLARKAGALDNGHLRLDQLMAVYRFQDEFELTQGLWLGRLKAHYGLYNTTRDVPFTRPGILMPQSIYFDRARNSLLLEDTVGYFQERRNELGFWRLDFGVVGTVPNDTELEDFFSANASLHGKQGYGQGFQFTWRSPLEQYYVGFAMANPEYKFETRNTNYLNPDGIINFITADGKAVFRNASGFFQYQSESWVFTFEVSRNDVIFSLENDLPDMVLKSISYYEQFEYRLSPTCDVFVRYDSFFNNKDDKYGHEYARSVPAQLLGQPSYSQYSIDSTLGISWRPTNDWLLRAEVHSVEGVSWLSYRENDGGKNWVKYWNLVALQASYRF